MATKADIDLFLSDPDYLALIGLEREHRLLFITDLSETRVSAFLGWLFSPQEGHGLGDQAFRELLLNAWRTNRQQELALDVPSPREILNGTFRDLLVHTEYRANSPLNTANARPIDIVLVSRQNRLVVVIENKFGSNVHSDQLTAYKHNIELAFPDYRRMLIYLDSNPENLSGDAEWIPLGYEWLIELISTHQTAGLLSERSMDALTQFKDYLTSDLGLNGEFNAQRDLLIENICRSHDAVLNVFKEFRRGNRNERLQNPALTLNEPLLIEYHQRHWLWDEILDESRHSSIVREAKKAFGVALEVNVGPAEVRMRLKAWERFETDAEMGQWVARVVAWSGRKASGTYLVWTAVNFRGIQASRELEVRDAALTLRDKQFKKPPAAAQWMRLSLSSRLSPQKAAAQTIEELRRVDAILSLLS